MNKAQLREELRSILPYLLFFTVLLSIIWLLDIFQTNRINNIEKEMKVTVGTTKRRYKSGKSTWKIKYYYNYNNKQYVNNSNNSNNIIVPDGKYYVVFEKSNPTNSLLIKIKISDTITNVPLKGWNFIPGNENLEFDSIVKLVP